LTLGLEDAKSDPDGFRAAGVGIAVVVEGDVETFAQAYAVVLEFHSRLVLSGWDGFARSDHEVVDAQEVVAIYEPARLSWDHGAWQRVNFPAPPDVL
jgi:hypothetical protein